MVVNIHTIHHEQAELLPGATGVPAVRIQMGWCCGRSSRWLMFAR